MLGLLGGEQLKCSPMKLKKEFTTFNNTETLGIHSKNQNIYI